MPTIPNFPESLVEEHKNWHHDRHVVDKANIPSGYGLEFLQFHRDLIARALAWYQQNGLDPRLIEPWVSVPEPIRQARCYNQAAEARILFELHTFPTADELGRFIESSDLHACIHREAAKLFGEPDINDFDTAPRNTVFYNIHGMIDGWWRNWEGLARLRESRANWFRQFEVKENEVLYYDVRNDTWWIRKRLEHKRGVNSKYEGEWGWVLAESWS